MAKQRPASASEARVEEALRRASQLHRAGDVAGASAMYEAVLRERPAHADACRLASLAARQLGAVERAVELAQRGVSAAPRAPMQHAALAEALADAGRPRDAIAALQAALRLAPDAVPMMAMLGRLLLEEGELVEAERWLEEALRRQPAFPPALFYLATVAVRRDAPARAAGLLERAIATGVATASAYTNLGSALLRQGEIERGVEAHRRAVAIDPDDQVAWSNLLFALLASDRASPGEVFEEHVRRGLALARSVGGHASAPPASAPDLTGRALRVGYVSPDLREHPVALFLEPVLRHHDPSRVHVTCYSDAEAPDQVTERLRPLAQVFRDVAGLDDDALAAQIAEDRIDVLVDLAVNSGGNRQALFARRAARVQISWLGYAATTGLPTMDFRLTDATVDPPGTTEKLHTERLLRLPEVLWCYEPPAEAAAIERAARPAGAPPRLVSASRLAKISERTVESWCELLRALPDATLVVQTHALAEPAARDAFARRFSRRGVDPARLELRPGTSMREYLELLSACDLALDTFPFSGGTTACNALWMGCPVVTLAEVAPWSRVTASVLGAVGLSSLVARTPGEYVELAASLARDRERLGELHRTLRGRLAASPLTDAPRFTRALEDALLRACAPRPARRGGAR